MVGVIRFESHLANKYIDSEKIKINKSLIQKYHHQLHEQSGLGKEYTGWLDWPFQYDETEFAGIKETAHRIREKAEVFLVIGIGGSYLGARSAIEFIRSSQYNLLSQKKGWGPQIFFIGNNVSPTYLSEIFQIIEDKEVYVNVISKSGTTLEPAIGFRLILQFMEQKYGKPEMSKRIVVTTDATSGALKKIADFEGFQTFTVPRNIGGRYSVLTSVGLLPMAVAGININEVMEGAKQAAITYEIEDIDKNDCYQYALIRNGLYNAGKTTEMLVNYDPALHYFSEWWKQLFGESEGKEGKGIFPSSASFSTDLHSIGQYIQDGKRNLFTTNLWIENSKDDLSVPELDNLDDNLHKIAGKSLHELNQYVCQGAMAAHAEGDVPVLKISIPEKSPYYYGQLVYFFEKACAMSGYLLGVNPFDQPGVEAYKRNVHALLET